MKRTFPILLALALLFLAGCDSSGTEEEKRTVDTARSFSHYYKNVLAAETKDTIYYIGANDYFIKYVDKVTGITGVLCGKAECSHDDKDCNAYTSYAGANCLFVDSGRLYWLCETENNYLTKTLYSAALDGTDRRDVVEFDKGTIPESQVSYPCFAFYDGYLYYSVVEHVIEDGEPNNYNYVCAFPLDPNKDPIVILHEKTDGDYNLSMQLYGDSLYIVTNDVHVLSKENGDTVSGRDFRLRRWDTQTCQLETLYEDLGSLLHWTMELWVTDDGVYFDRISQGPQRVGIYKYDFESGKCDYQFSSGVDWNLVGIADNLVTGFQITDNNDGVYDFNVVIKDFSGNVVVDDTYVIDLNDVFLFYNSWFIQFLGRDEACAYYAFYESGDASEGVQSYYTTIIQVALDGSGARELCSFVEDHRIS